MKHIQLIMVSTLIFLLPAISANAGRSNFHSGPSSYHFHRPHHGTHLYRGNFWPTYGLGLITGSLITSIVSPPPPRTIIYSNHAPQPVVVYRDIAPSPNGNVRLSTTQSRAKTDFILRTVKTEPALLNMRYTPDLTSTVVRRIPQDTTMYVLGAAADWLYVKTRDNHYGWIMEKYTSESKQPVG